MFGSNETLASLCAHSGVVGKSAAKPSVFVEVSRWNDVYFTA